MKEFFSIVIPVFNAKLYLPRCVNSIINQTYNNWHLYLVDDGSSDGSDKLCDSFSYENPQITAIHKTNGGVSDARNRGILESNGEWIFFVDADDFLELDSLFLINEFVCKYNPDLVLFNIKEISINKKIHVLKHPLKLNYNYNRFEIEQLIMPFACINGYSFVNSPCNKVYRASILKKNNIFFPSRVRGEDWIFNIKFLRCCQNMVATDALLYNYCRTPFSAMSTYCPEQFQLWEENWNVKQELIKKYNLIVDQKKLSRQFYVKIYYFLREILQNETKENYQNKQRTILHNRIVRECLKVLPTDLREMRAWISLKIRCIGVI